MMKNIKILIILLLSGTATFGLGIWAYAARAKLEFGDYLIYAAVLLVVGFSLITAFKQLKDQEKGLAIEDELSKRTKEKAAAKAFMGSFYLWTMILLFTSDSEVSREIPIGLGIMGMGLLFVGFWAYHNKKGIDNADAN